jgi:acylphosphatase
MGKMFRKARPGFFALKPVESPGMTGKMVKKDAQKMARRYVVSGRVQGVGYRAFAVRVAREIGLTGWVRNLANGDVEAHANGSAGQLDEFDGRLRAGPRWGEVRSVQATEAAVSDAAEFHIR